MNNYLSADPGDVLNSDTHLQPGPSFSRLVSCPVKLERRLDPIMSIYSYRNEYRITHLFSREVTWVTLYRAALWVGMDTC